MVRNTFNSYFIVILLTLMSSIYSNLSYASESKLILYIDKTKSILGRPIRAELYGISLKNTIADVNLSVLNEKFGVITDYAINDTTDKRWPNETIQILKLKLFPRQVGDITIPSIISGNAKTIAKHIYINTEGTGIPNVTLLANTPYKRQQFIVNISVSSKDPTSRLSIKKEAKIKGFESTPLPFIRIKEKDGTYTNKIGLAITALKAGQQSLEIPPVEYSVSGVSRKQYYFPYKIIDVKALPSYLPPTIAIGGITVQSKLDNKIVYIDSINYWNITVSGNVNNTYHLPTLSKSIKSTKDIKFLPAKIKRSTQTENNKLISTTNYSIPFKALSNSVISFPTLEIQYFSPDSEKIMIISHQEEKVLSVGILWRILIFSVTLLFISYISFVLYKYANKVAHSNKCRRKAISILEKSNKTQEIKKSIRLIIEAEGWQKNITIHQWGDLWGTKYKVNNGFKKLIKELSTSFYSSKPTPNLNKLSLKLKNVIINKSRY